MSTPSGYTIHKHLTSKLAAGITAVASLAALAIPFGAASADSYSSMRTNSYGNNSYASSNYNRNNYTNHNSYGNSSYPVRYSSYNTRGNYSNSYAKYPVRYSSYGNKYSSYSNQYMQRYSNYRWVYDPCLHRWVMIRYNNYSKCWEYCDSGQRYTGQVY